MSYSLRFLLAIGLDIEFLFTKDIIKTFHQIIKRRYEHFNLLKAINIQLGYIRCLPKHDSHWYLYSLTILSKIFKKLY